MNTRSSDRPAPIVEVNCISKTYSTSDGSTVRAVDDVSFSIAEQSVVGLLGPNGAGKTTTMKIVLGLIVPSDGTVQIEGTEIGDLGRARYDLIAAMLEGARNVYWRLTVRENMAYFASLQGLDPTARQDRHEAIIERLGLKKKADEPVKDLSRGMQQQAAMACTLARETPVVVLDEPTLGLDVNASRALRSHVRTLIEAEERTVLLSSHDMDIVQDVCDRVIIMNDGNVVIDAPVEEVVSVFEADAYTIKAKGDPSLQTRREIGRWGDVHRWERVDGGIEFDILVDESDEIFDVLTVLERASLVPVTLDKGQPDLEEAFLRVVDSADTSQV